MSNYKVVQEALASIGPAWTLLTLGYTCITVSYTHLDVYKRQIDT